MYVDSSRRYVNANLNASVPRVAADRDNADFASRVKRTSPNPKKIRNLLEYFDSSDLHLPCHDGRVKVTAIWAPQLISGISSENENSY